jgi:hypothetical protein
MLGDSSHLLHHSEVVPYRPALHELAIDQTVPMDGSTEKRLPIGGMLARRQFFK